MQNEEIIHLVLEKQVSHHNHQNITRGQKIADNIAKLSKQASGQKDLTKFLKSCRNMKSSLT